MHRGDAAVLAADTVDAAFFRAATVAAAAASASAAGAATVTTATVAAMAVDVSVALSDGFFPTRTAGSPWWFSIHLFWGSCHPVL